MNILLVLPKICEIKVFNITSPRYNKQIFPVPWHLIELRVHCMRLCTEACMCSDLVPLHPPPPPPNVPPVHVRPSSLSLIICKCIHLRSLYFKADIKVQKRNCTVFCFSIDYTKLLFSTSLWKGTISWLGLTMKLKIQRFVWNCFLGPNPYLLCMQDGIESREGLVWNYLIILIIN